LIEFNAPKLPVQNKGRGKGMVNMNTPESNVLVCVTDQLSSERLIRSGAAIAEKQGISLHVVCVLPEGFVSESTAAILQNLYDTANSLGAEMTFYFNSDPALTVAVHAKKIGSVHIVSGTPGADSSFFIETVKTLLPQLPISIVDADSRMYTFPAASSAVKPAVL
jgi:K+-sensing histidine kinase KdpD